MQPTRFGRTLGLLLVLGVVGSVVGCGSSAPQSSPAQLEEAGKAISEGQRKLHQQLKESAKTGGPDMRQSKFRRKS
jgi:hypothetical protein